MSSSSENAGGGVSFCGLLFIAFLVLKLCKVINWSWWWVTLPIWGPLSIAAVAFLLYGILWLFKKD
jgi:hypothetical protein